MPVSPTGEAPRSADYRFELPLSTLRRVRTR
jgi:hypothetical protein